MSVKYVVVHSGLYFWTVEENGEAAPEQRPEEEINPPPRPADVLIEIPFPDGYLTDGECTVSIVWVTLCSPVLFVLLSHRGFSCCYCGYFFQHVSPANIKCFRKKCLNTDDVQEFSLQFAELMTNR